MNPQTEKFIEQFNMLEEALAKNLNKNRHVPFSHMVYELSSRDMFVKRHKSLLEDLGDLRNVLVHKEGNEVIAVPSEAAVDKLERIVKAYTKPQTLYSMINHSVKVVRVTDSLAEALIVMKANDYTKIPVYDGDEFKGLLSGQALSKWLTFTIREDGIINEQLRDITVAEILKISGRKNEVKFLPRDMTVMEFMGIHINARPKSGVYLMTEHGKQSQKPIGIVTVYDYPRIADSINVL